MKTLRNFVVTGGLLRSNGDQAQVGDTVRLYPYEGDSFLGTIVAVAPVNCGRDRAYAIEYDLDVVFRACDLQDMGDVLDCCGLLEERVEAIEAQIEIPQFHNPHVIEVYRNNSLDLVSGEFTEIPMNTTTVDTATGSLVGGGVTIPRTGYWTMSASGALKNASSATRISIQILAPLIQGADAIVTGDVYGIGGYTIVMTPPKTIYLNKGDKLLLYMLQNSAGTVSVADNFSGYQPRLGFTEHSIAAEKNVVPLSTIPFVAFGDSNVKGNIPGESKVFGEWMSSDFTNLGFPGYSSSDLLAGINVFLAAGNQNANAVILAGSNDFLADSTPDIQQIADNIEAIYNQAKPLFNNLKVIIPGPANLYQSTGGSAYNSNRDLLVDELVSRPGISDDLIRLDLDPVVGVAGTETDRIYNSDKLHFTAIGHEYIAKEILAPVFY